METPADLPGEVENESHASNRTVYPADHKSVIRCQTNQMQLEDLIKMDNPDAVFAEVCHTTKLIHADLDLQPLRTAFEDTLLLFRGDYPGYRECNIYYHDFKHTTDCLTAMVRLLHGASAQGQKVSPDNLILGLIAALQHDTGYIQKNHEISGTGARFTINHIDRSIEFFEKYAAGHGKEMDLPVARNLLRCTGLDVKISGIAFKNREHELIGKALGTADLLGQMADRTYIERLPLLYLEFREGNVPGFDDELDLIKKTPAFWEYTKKRFAADLGGVDSYMIHHFRTRWGIDRDLYKHAIESNMKYLEYLIEHHQIDYRTHLRRGGLMERLARIEAAEKEMKSSCY